jgi:Tfp pilus assembly protein PilW
MRPERMSSLRRDDGFTLIELGVAAALGVLILVIVSGIVIGSMRTQSTVTELNEATASGSLVTSTIELGVRNASALEVAAVGSGVLLRARTVSTDEAATWGCTAWYYSSAEGTIRQKRSSTAIAEPASEAAVSGWTLLAEDVEAVPGTAVFSLAAGAGGVQTVSTVFQISRAGESAVRFETAASNRAVPSGEGPTCF